MDDSCPVCNGTGYLRVLGEKQLLPCRFCKGIGKLTLTGRPLSVPNMQNIPGSIADTIDKAMEKGGLVIMDDSYERAEKAVERMIKYIEEKSWSEGWYHLSYEAKALVKKNCIEIIREEIRR